MLRLKFYGIAVLISLISVSFSSSTFASEGGEGSKAKACPYAQDQHVDLGGHPLVIPQSAFGGKADETIIDGYRITPDVAQLKLVIVGPYSEVWEAGLSVLAGGKTCTAYYVGAPGMINMSTTIASPKTPLRN